MEGSLTREVTFSTDFLLSLIKNDGASVVYFHFRNQFRLPLLLYTNSPFFFLIHCSLIFPIYASGFRIIKIKFFLVGKEKEIGVIMRERVKKKGLKGGEKVNPNFLSNHEGGVFHSIFFPSIPFLVKQYAIATRGQACVSHRNNSYRSLPRDKRIEGRFMRLAGRDGGCSRGWSRERARILARLC